MRYKFDWDPVKEQKTFARIAFRFARRQLFFVILINLPAMMKSIVKKKIVGLLLVWIVQVFYESLFILLNRSRKIYAKFASSRHAKP